MIFSTKLNDSATYTYGVRRLFCFLVLANFALSVHASVPRVSYAAGHTSSAVGQPVFDHGRPVLALTAAPADVSFYREFYPLTAVRHEQPKTTLLHWFGNLIKKAVRR
ncbi:MAG TPA: hypothetical protein VGH51_09540 [Candidatus Angelobacter sp.]